MAGMHAERVAQQLLALGIAAGGAQQVGQVDVGRRELRLQGDGGAVRGLGDVGAAQPGLEGCPASPAPQPDRRWRPGIGGTRRPPDRRRAHRTDRSAGRPEATSSPTASSRTVRMGSRISVASNGGARLWRRGARPRMPRRAAPTDRHPPRRGATRCAWAGSADGGSSDSAVALHDGGRLRIVDHLGQQPVGTRRAGATSVNGRRERRSLRRPSRRTSGRRRPRPTWRACRRDTSRRRWRCRTSPSRRGAAP